MKASELFVKCLENEGVEYIFGVPGEENVDIMDALLESPIRFITTRHEQGAAFMADVYGRLTGKAGVCLSTLGPGATNLITGVADADMDRAPVVAVAGQGATTRMHKESHQILDLVNMFEPITKYATQIREPEIVTEIVRKAFKVAQTEKPGACFIDFPENIAAAEVTGKRPIEVQKPYTSAPPDFKIEQAAKIISQAECPIILAGNGVIRAGATDSLVAFAEVLHIPVATTFMAKGAIPFAHELSLGTVGIKGKDLVSFGFDKADVVICVGYDMVEYHPEQWNPDCCKAIVHIDASPAEVDEHYIVEVGVLGEIGEALRAIAWKAKPQTGYAFKPLRQAIVQEMACLCRRSKLSGQTAENCLGPASSPSRRGHRDFRCGRAQNVDGADVSSPAAEHLHHLQRLCLHGHRRARRRRREAGSSRAQNCRRHRRRGVHDELAGDRNRAASRHAFRHPDLERLGVRPDHLASAAPLRPAQPHRFQESRLREIRRELRRQRLPRRARRRSHAHCSSKPSPTTPCRSSIVRWTTRRT